ncbi:MAG TPA: lysophospholipid acyltransferase family protein [Candidatus Methylopumilus sp.]|jgi:1-acyl-sn-glycerol-3-phosphate acyltransferase
MLYLRSIIFLVGMWIFTIPFTLASLLTFPFPPVARYKFISIWAKTMLYWLRISCNLNFVVKGEQNIGSTASIVLSKHQSAWETLAFQKIFPPQVWVLKQELLWIPFFGWGLAMASPIAINRKAGRKSLEQILTQGLDRLKKGFWIVMFPEGTRTQPGQKGKYHIGGAWVASKTNTQVIPVAHNAGLFWPKNSILKKPGTIQVSIGKPIDVKNKEPNEIIKLTENWIEKEVLYLND